MRLPHRKSYIYEHIENESQVNFKDLQNVENWKSYPSYNRIKDLIKKPIGTEKVEPLPSFMFGLFNTLRQLKKENPESKKVLIPNQGGWSGYQSMIKELKLKERKYQTNLGILNEIKIEEDVLAIIVPNFPGYIAKNDMKAISNKIGEKTIINP